MIPGDDTSMRILTTYSDRNGKVRFASFGQTLLEDMRPMGVGNPLAIVSRTDEAIVAEAARLLELSATPDSRTSTSRWIRATAATVSSR